jgi:hypothetical protein
MLEQYVEVPRPMTVPRMRYIPSPDAETIFESEQEFQMIMTSLAHGQRYTLDTNEFKKSNQLLHDYLFYRRKFEQSQRATLANGGESAILNNITSSNGVPSLNLQQLDPRVMQQQIEEDKAKKRGPKLDENLRLKICDLGNGCWTYHHFSTEI